eukprot:1183921-Prorocentrum_minimum.AAC.3
MQNATPEQMLAPNPEVKEPLAKFPANYMATGVAPREDFVWSETSEPHYKRKKAILAKHPEIRDLYGPDPNTMGQVSSHGLPLCVGGGSAYYVAEWESILNSNPIAGLSACTGCIESHRAPLLTVSK